MNINSFSNKIISDYKYTTVSGSKAEEKYNLNMVKETNETSNTMSESEIMSSFYNLCKEYPGVNFRLMDTFDGEGGFLNGQSYDVGNIMSLEGVNIQLDSAAIVAMNQSEKSLKNMHAIIQEAIDNWSTYKNLGMDKETLSLPYATVDISFSSGRYKLSVTHSQGDAETDNNVIIKTENLDKILSKVNDVQNNLQDQFMQMVAESLVQKEKMGVYKEDEE